MYISCYFLVLSQIMLMCRGSSKWSLANIWNLVSKRKKKKTENRKKRLNNLIGIWQDLQTFVMGCFVVPLWKKIKKRRMMSTSQHDSSLTFCCWKFLNGASLFMKWSFEPKGIRVLFFPSSSIDKTMVKIHVRR